VTFGLGSDHDEFARVSSELQIDETVQVGTPSRVQRLQPIANFSSPLVTSLLQASRDASSESTASVGSVHCLPVGTTLQTVREVAAQLRVCTATVYDMIERGELEHVRVSNAIRVVVRPAGLPIRRTS
jgi:excisionase family DNA binding protein